MDVNNLKNERPDLPCGPLAATTLLVPTPSSSPRGRKTRALLVVFMGMVGASVHLPWPSAYASTTPVPSHDALEPDFDWTALEPSKTLQWTPCYSGQKCARLLLPLDYDTPDGPTTAIALRLLPATDTENYRGPILINPGGPGGIGTSFLGEVGPSMSAIVGPSFDILGFDPRGIGASTPSASCFETDSQRKIWALQDDHRLLNVTDDTVTYLNARDKLVAQRCAQKIGGEWGIARFMSTQDVARDMLEITKQFGFEKLQFWGFSYGSVLGQYFAAIYPDKVGRVIIDGVYDGYNYRAALWNSNLADMETVIDSFFNFCHQAGPEKCPLYESSPEKIRARYFALLEAVEANPVPIPGAEPPFVVTRKLLQTQFFLSTYSPITEFPTVADTAVALEKGNQSALVQLAPLLLAPPECNCTVPKPFFGMNEGLSPVACGDGDEHPYDPEVFANFYDALVAVSPHAGPIWAELYLMCAAWNVRPKHRWTGPLAAKNTSHPLLVISPRFDPVCPLSDARKVQERYGGSRLLIQDSYGHSSLAGASLCTLQHVRAYMQNGTLPEDGTVCEVILLPFVGPVPDARRAPLSEEDAELLEAAKRLSESYALPRLGGK